jgi:peroxiredoxin
VGVVGDHAAAVMAHPPGAPDEDAQFARSLGISDDHIVVVGNTLRVKSTPTIVLVDQRGTILHAWEGVGPAENQAKIAGAVKASLK